MEIRRDDEEDNTPGNSPGGWIERHLSLDNLGLGFQVSPVLEIGQKRLLSASAGPTRLTRVAVAAAPQISRSTYVNRDVAPQLLRMEAY